MARRSTRLSSRNSSTPGPKRVSLSHDAPTHRTPRTVPAKLASLDEGDEMPGAFPQSTSPSQRPSKLKKTDAATPKHATPIKPAEEEMHPQLHHQTTAKPRDEARHLGFSNMAPNTEPAKHTSKIATLQGTPSRARDLESDVKSPSFQFTFHREHSLELSPEAKKLMHEKREEAARIREQMIANGEGLPSIDELMAARKIAKPKGRFSQVHTKEFEKMDSIAAHPSAFRLKQNTPSAVHSPAKSVQKQESTVKSLKRSPSKAGLVNPSSTPSRPSSRDTNKPLPAAPGSQLPRLPSVKDLKKAATEQTSPSKRVKHTVTEDVSATRPASSHEDKPLPATPRSKQQGANVSHLSTPTQASLARAASVKSVKTKIPAPASFTPAKPVAAFIAKQPVKQDEHAASPALLARSPSKASIFPKRPDVTTTTQGPTNASLFLARSPTKPAPTKKPSEGKERSDDAPAVKAAPLLSRSPVKGAMPKYPEIGSDTEQSKTSAIPFLARSPSKLPVSNLPSEPQETPGKSTGKGLLGRFNLLRQSPVKSILRSPQRLYSDDPSKVAAGTHLATPPKFTADTNKALPPAPRSATASAQKHVDFTSSTKARFDKAHSSTPSKTPTPSPKPAEKTDVVEDVQYPDLSNTGDVGSPSPQKRRQTGGPGDFTFRADSQGIIFSQSPNAPASANKRASTIRMVSSDMISTPAPAAGSKKRKFEFENKTAATAEDVDGAEEKENTPVVEDVEEEQRPAKRTKPSAPEPPAKKASSATAPTATSAARRTTLGVKPKGTKNASPVKRASTISMARLNALSQPKRR
ncbi:hypothetical protein PRZ48_002260 [Zasmidium cellare]|uniref:Erythromycin esterase n=1 Tax=Zasmidium cellare TaxID=395010 RepID=A0ABR0F5K8_ZASCE|nr:hypothetical protein PRZ48_002260 [Zasmidium cellare]